MKNKIRYKKILKFIPLFFILISITNETLGQRAQGPAYSSSSVTQFADGDGTAASLGVTDVEILKVAVSYNRCNNCNSGVSSLTFTLNNTDDADIENAKLYYTGTTNAFSTATQVGTTINNPTGDITFNIGQAGIYDNTVYYWLTFDISSTATPCTNTIDALVKSGGLVISGTNIGNKTPSPNNPTGNKTISGPGCWTYCTSTFSNNDDFITNVTFEGIDNTSAGDNGYADNTGGAAGIVFPGQSYNISVSVQDDYGTYSHQVQAWFDWNNDGDFDDTGEYYNLGTQSVGGTPVEYSSTITVPISATVGNTRMRITEDLDTDVDECGSWTYGETEDYTINIVAPIVITTNPSNQNICANSSADFNVEVSNTEPVTFQWKYQGNNVTDGTPAGAVYSGTNTPTLTISDITTAGTYSAYTCEVYNTSYSTTSSGADLIVNSDIAPDAPTDLTKSEDLLCPGDAITLGATVSSGTLEWYSGTCSGTSVTSPVSPGETTTYYAKAYDSGTGCYSACSEITVNVMDDIVFIEEPEDQYGCAGESLSFSVIATGAGLTYQWQENSGSGFTDITNGGVYSGAETMDLVISDVTGLDGNNYQCVVTGSCDAATSTTATINEISSGLSGTYTVGTAGVYATLKAAFDDINAFGLSGNTFLEVISNITETAEASLNEWVDCAGNNNYTVTIYPTGATRTISGNIATSLVTLNGADKVTIDGRIDMTGTANSLVFSNSNTSGATLTLINDACANTIAYSTLEGASTETTNGVVFFSTGSTTGNDSNLITECTIKDAATTPLYGIYSLGTTGTNNNDNTISNCDIYNFFNSTGLIARGISLSTGNTRWTISGNSIYQTSARNDASFYGISIWDANGGEFNILGNYIGGTASQCGGSALTYTNTSYGIGFEGIIMYTSSVGVSLIKDNVFKNISFQSQPITSSSQLPIFTGIDIYSGRIDVIENIVGDESTNSINVTVDDYLDKTAWNNGIYHAGEGNVIGNEIGSITFDGTIGDQCGFNAIEISGTIITDQIISDNIIGHPTTANSINFASGTTPAMTMGGIYFGTAGDFHTTVSNNSIGNINLGTNGTSCFFIGLNNQASAGDQTIIGNEIHNITSSSARTGSFSSDTDFPAIVGIRTNNTVAGANLNISNNSIYNLTSTNTTADIKVFGIFANTATSGNQKISANNIHSFATTNTSYLVWQEGIWVNSGAVTLTNNMIRLGVSGVNNNNFIAGIEMQSTSANSVLFNSIYIGGTATGSQNTFAYYRSSTGTTDIRNNIFVNARTGGTGIPYAYFLSSTSNLTSDYNIYSNNALGVNAYAGALRTSLAQIQTGTSQDANSIVTNPLYVSPTDPGIACDLHIPLGSPAIGEAVPGTGITQDIDNQTRASTPCIGADENVTAPYGTNVYGIYIPDGINGTVEDVEILSEGGAPGGTGFNVANPNEAYWPNVFISDYHVITASNLMCTNSEFTFTTEDGSPDWLFGNGAIPSSASATPATSYYESTGYKDNIESVKVFSDFNNITLESPDPGLILGAPSGAGCPTTYTYTSSEAGSSGYLYEWYATAPSGCEVSIDNTTASSTDITFVNQTGVDQIFLVTLIIETECCGKLKPVERYITIYPGPKMPEIDGGPFATCEGGAQAVFILNPDPEYSYEWFDAETGGTQLGSGTNFTFTDIPEGITSYWVQSTNSFGCSSQRTEIQIEGIKPVAPLVDDQSTCGDSDVTFYINSPDAGYIYNWYTGSCGGTLLQSGTSTSFTYNVTSTENFYVSATPPGCAEGYCATPTANYLTPTNPIRWEGDDATSPKDWFVNENWENGCLPNCGTNVRIDAGLSNYPEIGFHLDQAAAAKNMELADGASLTFIHSKANLELCGDFNHNGSFVTADYGTVSFIGATEQKYIKSGTATGEFHNVKIENTATTPKLTLEGGDMIISSKGSINFITGVVTTGIHCLIIKNDYYNSLNGHSKNSYIYGNLRRYIASNSSDQYDFPVGTETAYRLANLNNHNVSGPTYFDVKFMESFDNDGTLDPTIAQDAGTPYNAVAGEGIWQINPDAALTSGSYDIRLFFDDGYGFQPDGTPISNGFAGLVDNQFGILKRPSNSSLACDWIGEATGDLPADDTEGRLVSDGFALRSNITAFSEFGIGKSDVPLPVELSDFNAECLSNGIQINWITESETNNEYFTLYRSTDAETYSFISQINGQGNSNYKTEYSYMDESYSGGPVYYKLRQNDYDGKFTESKLVFINCTLAPSAFYIVPNPFKEEVRIVFESPTNYPVNVQITDVLGHVVYQTKIPRNTQEYRIQELSQQKPGSYYLNLIYNETVITEKLIKM